MKRAPKSLGEAELECAQGESIVEFKAMWCDDHEKPVLHPLTGTRTGHDDGLPYVWVRWQCDGKTRTFKYGGPGMSSYEYEDGSPVPFD